MDESRFSRRGAGHVVDTRTAAEIQAAEKAAAAREAAGLSCPQAARLIHATPRAWQLWESGERRMHPAFFELFERKKPRRGA